MEEVKSGKLTQYVPIDSASLNGIPFIVIFVDCGLTPLILIPVYPIPAPASDVITTDGKNFNKIGRS